MYLYTADPKFLLYITMHWDLLEHVIFDSFLEASLVFDLLYLHVLVVPNIICSIYTVLFSLHSSIPPLPCQIETETQFSPEKSHKMYINYLYCDKYINKLWVFSNELLHILLFWALYSRPLGMFFPLISESRKVVYNYLRLLYFNFFG